MKEKRQPCHTCPWRSSTPKRGFPGGFINVAALKSACRDVFAPAMQCHCTPDGKDAQVCVGFAVRVGFDAPSLRMAAALGRYDPDTVSAEGCDLLTIQQLVKKHGGVCVS